MTAYRKPSPYRKSQTYRGEELVPGVAAPGTSSVHGLPFGEAADHSVLSRLPVLGRTARGALSRGRWGGLDAAAFTTRVPLQHATQQAQALQAPWDSPTWHADLDRVPFRQSQAHDTDAALPWAETSEKVEHTAPIPYGAPARFDVSASLTWDAITAHGSSMRGVWHSLAARGALIALPWGAMGKHQNDYIAPWPVEPNPGEPGSDPITVPILPVYFMIPSLSAVRLPERTPVPLLSASLSTDAASWGWAFTAAMPLASLDLVNPATREDPVELEVTINGYVWTVLVDSFDLQRRFALKTVSLRGRSRSAVLAAPIAPRRSRTQVADRTAAQLAAEELTGTGWTMVWDAVDWLVPGGTFSYADLAPMEALVQIAESIGARIETDRALLQLAAKPTYPISPWAWEEATPYAILPASIVASADGQWQGGPNANGVYVYSENAGFGALVKIEGTGGETQLPQIVNRLAVSADPVRELGRQRLAASGKIKNEQITTVLMPSPADPGLIPIGALLEINDSISTWRGQCMGVRIIAQRSGSAFSVRQSLQIERHFR